MADAITSCNPTCAYQVLDIFRDQGSIGQVEVATGGWQDEDAVAIDELGEDADRVVKPSLLAHIVLSHIVGSINLTGITNAQGHAEIS